MCLSLRFGILGAFAVLPMLAQVLPRNHALFSGYAAAGATNSVTDVKGSWIVPAVTCSGVDNSRAYFWVGMDGVISPTVEQIGIAVLCVTDTTAPIYYAWYEFYPNSQIQIPITISANDKVSAEVNFSGTQFTLTLTDITTGSSSGLIKSPPGFLADRSSAECLVEMPGNVSLADFGNVFFGQDKTGVAGTCFATVGGQRKPIGQFPTVYQLTMVNKYSKAVPSTLSADLSTFRVTSCTTPSPEMVGWWPGDGDFKDIIGSNDGAEAGVVPFVPGAVNKAFSFDGNSSVQAPNSAAIDITADLTIETWINPAGSTRGYIVLKGNGDDFVNAYALRYGDGNDQRLLLSVADGGTAGSYFLTGAGAVPVSKFSHVAVVIQGTTAAIYVNGTQVSGDYQHLDVRGGTVQPATELTSNRFSDHGAFWIGNGPPVIPFNGLIDEVSVYNAALSASQIQSIYKAGRAGKCRLGK